VRSERRQCASPFSGPDPTWGKSAPAGLCGASSGHFVDRWVDQLSEAPPYGSETGPGPQLVTWGKSTILSVDAHGFKFEYTLNSAKHIPFDWVGP
jgi:hypothetical protein